jgi:hypothetical protein
VDEDETAAGISTTDNGHKAHAGRGDQAADESTARLVVPTQQQEDAGNDEDGKEEA